MHQMVFYHTVVLFYKTRQSETPAALYNMASIDYAYSTRAKVKGMYKVVSSIKVPSDLGSKILHVAFSSTVEYAANRSQDNQECATVQEVLEALDYQEH